MITSSGATGRIAAQQPPRRDRTVESRALSQQDFLQLLVAEMKNQNPLEPQKNSEFIAEMAQFSLLEQLRTLNESMTALQTAATFSQASALLGKTVLTSSSDTSNAVLARLEASTGGVVAYISGLPPADSQPGTWELRTAADGSVTAVFASSNGLPPTTKTGKFDASGMLSDLIPGVTVYATVPNAGGTDRIVIEPMFAGKVDRIVMQDQKPKLLVKGQLVDLSDVVEVQEGAGETL